MSTRLLSILVYVALSNGGGALAQGQPIRREDPPIQDNSFLIEEAYNQERGVVQHISTFSRLWNSKDWSYTFTEEWPAPRNWRHQVSYTLVGTHAGAFAGTGGGMGDTVFNYRYQALGDGDTRVAFAPRFSVLFPTGDVRWGRGSGGVGGQINLPVSIVAHPRVITHWNVGCALTPNARSSSEFRARSAGYNLGQSVIFAAHPRLNLMIESVAGGFQAVVGPGRAEWARAAYLSPGVRGAFNFATGLQIVPGIAAPIGIGPSSGERGLFLYLSLEHPFSRTAEREQLNKGR